MDKLVDYVKWIGSLDFDVYPFREADALVLCVISYFDVGPVFREHPGYVRDCLPMIESDELKLEITGGDMGNREIFEAAARSARFGNLLMTDYESELMTGPSPVQFAAVTFHCPGRFSFIAFRGTDASLAGWQEDFMISFTRTDAQMMAQDYAERMLSHEQRLYPVPSPGGDQASAGLELYGPVWYMGGHSKGGNQALYAACTITDDSWSKVRRAYLLDGPGFCPEVMDLSLIDRIDAKSTRIIPEFDVIGKLFEPKITDTKIVHSYRDGVEQHSLASWLVDHGDLALAPMTDPKANWLNNTLNRWITSIPQESRPIFIGELFDALSSDGVDSLDDLTLDSMQSALLSLREKSDITKQTLKDLPKSIVFDDIFQSPEVQEVKEQAKKSDMLTWLKESPLAHALILTAAGAACLISRQGIVEFASLLLVLSMAIIQCGLTFRRLMKNNFNTEGMQERIILSMVMVGLLICLIVKEQAMFLLGSVILGILFFVLSYYTGTKAVASRGDKFLHTLYVIECVISIIYAVSFFVIPSATINAYALSIGVLLVIDGVVRLIRCLILQRSNRRLLSK